jgi:hypothetical protein
LRAFRAFPIAGTNKDFAVLSAFFTMKLVNRHETTIACRAETSRMKPQAGVVAKFPISVLAVTGDILSNESKKPWTTMLVAASGRKFMKRMMFGLLPLIATGAVWSGCAHHHEQTAALTPTSRTVVVTTTTTPVEPPPSAPVIVTTAPAAPPTHTVVVTAAPPPPRVEAIPPPPSASHVWTQGYWVFSNSQWIWMPGHWEARPRANSIWVPGNWEVSPDGRSWVWTPGYWM